MPGWGVCEQPLSHCCIDSAPTTINPSVLSPPELESEPPNRVEVSESNPRITTGTYLTTVPITRALYFHTLHKLQPMYFMIEALRGNIGLVLL